MTIYSDDFLEALGAWQRGWREAPERKAEITAALIPHIDLLSGTVKSVGSRCYRKRFLYGPDLVPFFLGGLVDDGISSWTVDEHYARNFKGFDRGDGSFAGLYAHDVLPGEVVLNLVALWKDADFISAVDAFKLRGGPNWEAIVHFGAAQGEVILSAPLLTTDVYGFVGRSSPFDDLCDVAGVARDDEARNQVFRHLLDQGIQPETPQWTSPDGAQFVIARARLAFAKKVSQVAQQAKKSAGSK